MKKTISILLIIALSIGLFAACADPNKAVDPPAVDSTAPIVEEAVKPEEPVTPAEAGGTVYYLNFKPEVAEVYNQLAVDYNAETGNTLKVQTAASGGYEQTLKAEMGKTDAPAIFQINGPRGYQSWKDYTADLSGTELYAALNDKSLAVVGDDGGVYGIPYVVEGYGIIYNEEITDKYFALEGRATTIASMDEVRDFATLKAVAEDMTAHLADLGIEGVFASTSLAPGEDWRWQTHLANVPFAQEFSDDGVSLGGATPATVSFKYADNYKNIFDLYINNSVTDRKMLGSSEVGGSMAEFGMGEVAFVQNGNWAWNQLVELGSDNVVKEDKIKFLPIYTGIEGESGDGLCIGTENYFAINSQASEADQKLAADFLYWLFSSETGKDYVVNKLNFVAPFTTFTDDEKPTDPLAREILRWMEDPTVKSVPWAFTIFPGQNFKDAFGSDLLAYAQGNMEWNAVVEDVKTNWATEAAAA